MPWKVYLGLLIVLLHGSSEIYKRASEIFPGILNVSKGIQTPFKPSFLSQTMLFTKSQFLNTVNVVEDRS